MSDQKKTAWDRIGGALASIAHGAARAALWASQHPEVLQVVGAIAVKQGANPNVVSQIETGAGVAGQILGNRSEQ